MTTAEGAAEAGDVADAAAGRSWRAARLDQERLRDELDRTARAATDRIRLRVDGRPENALTIWRRTLGPDTAERARAVRILRRHLEKVGEPWLAAARNASAGLARRGHAGRGAAYEAACGCDVSRLLEQCTEYLAATRTAYDAVLADSGAAGGTVGDLLRGCAGTGGRHRPVPVGPLVRRLVEDHHWPLGGVRYETDSTAGVRGSAWCEAVRIPDDVRVRTGPVDSAERVRDLLHESAHAAHFRLTEPVTGGRDGDLGLVEAWAVAFEAVFDVTRTGVLRPLLHEPHARPFPLDLVLARVQVARLLFAHGLDELSLEAVTATDLATRHAQVFTAVVGVEPGPLEWARDVLGDLPGADRVRSWLIGAQLRARIRERASCRWAPFWREQGLLFRDGQPRDGERWLADRLGLTPDPAAWIAAQGTLVRGS